MNDFFPGKLNLEAFREHHCIFFLLCASLSCIPNEKYIVFEKNSHGQCWNVPNGTNIKRKRGTSVKCPIFQLNERGTSAQQSSSWFLFSIPMSRIWISYRRKMKCHRERTLNNNYGDTLMVKQRHAHFCWVLFSSLLQLQKREKSFSHKFHLQFSTQIIQQKTIENRSSVRRRERERQETKT